jgi:hypothetical protein
MTDTDRDIAALHAIIKNEMAQLWKAIYALQDAMKQYAAVKGDK